jgi:hypothetical protein
MNNNKTVGFLTTFWNFDEAFSLTSVCRDQLTAFVKYGYKTILFVLPSFKDDEKVPKGVEIRKIVPQLILEPYKNLEYPSHWKEDVKKAREMFEKNMKDVTHLICHDIFFIDTYLPYNIALREASDKLPNLERILAWTHSAPSTRPNLEDNPHANRYTLPPKTTLVYLNHDKVTDLAEMYGAWNKDVRVVHNSRDPRTFWGLDPLTVNLVDKYGILDADIISVYPVSTPRMISGKALDKVIKIHGKLKQLGHKTKLIVCNAHANAEKDQRMIAETSIWAASDHNLNNDELIFTSQEERPKYELGVPGRVVSDLFRLSNVFIFPTISENSSLVLAEAMLSGNLLVLNRSVGTLREHAGTGNALYFDFSYREKKEENEAYYLDLAKIIDSEFKVSKPLQAKRQAFQKQNYDFVFKRELEPILYEQ